MMPKTPWILGSTALFCGQPVAPVHEQRDWAVSTVRVSPDSMTLQLGDAGRAVCTPRNQFGTRLTNVCGWRALDTAIAKVTPTGDQTASVKAVKPAMPRIRVWVGTGGIADTLWVTVADTVSSPPANSLPVPLRTISVSTTAQLNAALQGALPGDGIVPAGELPEAMAHPVW